MKRIVLGLLALAVLPFAGEAAAQDYQGVVNAANGASSVSKDELSKIFLKKSTKWADGTAAVAVDLWCLLQRHFAWAVTRLMTNVRRAS